MLEYCDEFGHYSCERFMLFWDGPPLNQFTEDAEDDCALFYSYPAPSIPGQHYLLPCEQPDEREAREKQESNEIARRAAAAAALAPTPKR
jgi:hypothetical protein